jgi:hypothetical protein
MPRFPNPFQRRPPSLSRAREAIRGWSHQALGSPEALELTISEIDCGDLACPGLETIILVMRPGEATQAVKIRKAMEAVTEIDVLEAMRDL